MTKKHPKRPPARQARKTARPATSRSSRPRRSRPIEAATRLTKPSKAGEVQSADAARDPVDGRVVTTASDAPVVGIGMSAGGLEACSQVLEMLPSSPGFAIIVVQHLSPHTPSALPALLGARATMRVTEATTGTVVVPNCVYVIPPDRLLELADGRVRLLPRTADHAAPVNHFFDSLAEVMGDRAVAVVLSGTGTDGAEGARAVKLRGGTVIVQELSSAKYDGMPRAALENGSADFVLPPADIARKLVDIFSQAPPAKFDHPISDDQLDQIYELLRVTSGVDFAHYKQPTLRRRIVRRMMITRVPDIVAYIAKLKGEPDEVRSLYQDILIHVTRFFREPDSFAALASSVFPKILADRRGDNPVRVWVAGCATGEEVYSLAISLCSALGDDAGSTNMQVFGTDVSEAAVDFARQGQYPVNIADDVPAETLRRYFTKTDGGYRINKMIRDRCVFARQDLTRDPPFSKLDLILCRNVLIYMDASLQRKVIRIFHYALKSSGYLVLGQAETIGADGEPFSLVNKKHRIYRKKPIDELTFSTTPKGVYTPLKSVSVRVGPDLAPDVRAAQNEANRAMLDRYGPPAVLVNDDMNIVQFRGHTGIYLEHAPGDASFNLLKLAREGLLHGLRSALQSARKTRKPVRKEGLRVRSNGGWSELDLQVIPITSVPNIHYLVVFDQATGQPKTGKKVMAPPAATGRDGKRAARLEDELAATREYLQSIIQEVEAANEELQSANEEILSSNEELQSTNEELDTAKEELQSTNEELNTLNEELYGRNEELTRVNSDLVNLLGSVQIAIVIVSTDLRIRRFTPMAEKLLNMIPADIGRPITQLRPNVDVPDIGDRVLEVIDRVEPFERDVRDNEGRWFSLRIRPYKGIENRIEGAVVAVFDVDGVRRFQTEVARMRSYAEAIADAVAQPVMILDRSLNVRRVNPAFYELFGLGKAEVEGRLVFDLRDGQWHTEAMKAFLDRVLGGGVGGRTERAELEIGRRRVMATARALDGGKDDQHIVVVLEDQTSAQV
jgi:two-component system, chemotaxis family, CheB/CheR fusion protein